MNVHLTKHLAFCINITNINCMSWFEMNMAWIFTVRLLWFNTWLSNAGDCSLMPQAKKKSFFCPLFACVYMHVYVCVSSLSMFAFCYATHFACVFYFNSVCEVSCKYHCVLRMCTSRRKKGTLANSTHLVDSRICTLSEKALNLI